MNIATRITASTWGAILSKEQTMSNNLPSNSNYDFLYEISIEELSLSAASLKLVESVGITSIGDCLDYYFHIQLFSVTVSLDLRQAMESEVKAQLQNTGYWVYYERATNSDN
jgi:hypothetical protein